MNDFIFVYRLRSIMHPEEIYTGITTDLKARLQKHNSGSVPHTSKFKPWKIDTAHAFISKEKAISFERYLKSGSGREFARRHF